MRAGCSPRMRTCFRQLAVNSVWLWISLFSGCGAVQDVYLPNESNEPIDPTRYELLARFAHISDAHVTDEESPARLTLFAELTRSAWRPQEAYSTQVLDGTLRAINKLHVAEGPVHFVVHTGDAVDNNQWNEWQWFVGVFDGGLIDPRSGPDDRSDDMKPEPLMDPHEPFTAQGLYRNGVHGPLPTIAWYNVFGNHDHFAVGVFPIVSDAFGHLISPLPYQQRVGFTLPVRLDPLASFGWGVITDANPGPPTVGLATYVEPNEARRFATWTEAVELFGTSVGEPSGHGFDLDRPDRTWFSTLAAPGIRLIVLNSSTPAIELPTIVHSEGAISVAQRAFLRRELEKAEEAGEVVIVATHHPSGSLLSVYGSSLVESSMVDLLNEFPCVKMHLAGHWHRNAVIDRGGYLEIVTGSLMDAPQEGRFIEIWRHKDDGEITLRYRQFSHLTPATLPNDPTHAPILQDPYEPMRRLAAELAGVSVR